jgi:hypothetical protein
MGLFNRFDSYGNIKIVIIRLIIYELEGLVDNFFVCSNIGNNRCNSVAKLFDNKTFKRSRNLSVLGLAILLSFSIVFSQKNITNISSIESLTSENIISQKIQIFEKMSAEEKQKEIYRECLETHQLMNKPTISTGGTEYLPNDNARIFARLLDGNSRPINLASCNATVYYPNNTKFLDNVPLTFLEKGIYYYDFITPNITGNYITIFDCFFPASIYFHKKLINLDIGAGTPTYLDTFPFDDGNNVTINNAWIFYNVTGGGGGAINNYYFNGNFVGQLTGITQILNVTLNISNFILGENQEFSIIRSALSSTINTVRLYVNYTYNNPLTTIRGQNEVHITNVTSNVEMQLSNISSQIWNHPTRNLTYYPNTTDVTNYTYFNDNFNQTWFNQQTIYNFIQSMNTTLVNNQVYLKSKIDDIWDYVQEMIVKISGTIIS